MKWLVQPVKVEKEKIEELVIMLEQADIDYDLVYPLNGQILNAQKQVYEFKDDETYFVCGSYPLTRYVNEIRADAVFSLEHYTFDNLMSIFDRENFVNDDAKIVHSKDIEWIDEEMFVRPVLDDKAFNGGIYNKNTLNYDGPVVVAKPKEIAKEHRFFVIDGQVITGSLYKMAGQLHSNGVVDEGALNFAKEMAQKFKEPGFVIDIATIDGRYKIMELNCLNCAGFYDISLYKLIMSVQDFYEKKSDMTPHKIKFNFQ